jgi:large subunit ribosomal protein L6
VGYQADLQGKNISLKVGLSHPVIITPPDSDTSFEVPKDSRGRVIHIDGINNEVVGQIASEIRAWRPPEPYLGKGIRYSDERVRRKAGKTGKK